MFTMAYTYLVLMLSTIAGLQCRKIARLTRERDDARACFARATETIRAVLDHDGRATVYSLDLHRGTHYLGIDETLVEALNN